MQRRKRARVRGLGVVGARSYGRATLANTSACKHGHRPPRASSPRPAPPPFINDVFLFGPDALARARVRARANPRSKTCMGHESEAVRAPRTVLPFAVGCCAGLRACDGAVRGVERADLKYGGPASKQASGPTGLSPAAGGGVRTFRRRFEIRRTQRLTNERLRIVRQPGDVSLPVGSCTSPPVLWLALLSHCSRLYGY